MQPHDGKDNKIDGKDNKSEVVEQEVVVTAYDWARNDPSRFHVPYYGPVAKCRSRCASDKASVGVNPAAVKIPRPNTPWWVIQSLAGMLMVIAFTFVFSDLGQPLRASVSEAFNQHGPQFVNALYQPITIVENATLAADIVKNLTEPECDEPTPLALTRLSVTDDDGAVWWHFSLDLSTVSPDDQSRLENNSTLVEISVTVCGYIRILWTNRKSVTANGRRLAVQVEFKEGSGGGGGGTRQFSMFAVKNNNETSKLLSSNSCNITFDASFFIYLSPPELVHARLQLDIP
jgi:hypothetical protein